MGARRSGPSVLRLDLSTKGFGSQNAMCPLTNRLCRVHNACQRAQEVAKKVDGPKDPTCRLHW